MAITYEEFTHHPSLVAAFRKFLNKKRAAKSTSEIISLMAALLTSLNSSLDPGSTVPLIETDNSLSVSYYDPSSNTIYLTAEDGKLEIVVLREYAYGVLGFTENAAENWAKDILEVAK